MLINCFFFYFEGKCWFTEHKFTYNTFDTMWTISLANIKLNSTTKYEQQTC